MRYSLKQKMAVQDTVLSYIQNLMVANNLSPSLVEDVLNKILVQLHPLIVEEILTEEEEEKKRQEKIDKMNASVAALAEESIPLDQEEVDDGTGVNTDNN